MKPRVWLLILALLVAWPTIVQACPMCKEAISAASAEDQELGANLPQAMNNSIYFMVSVPYVTLGVVAFLIIRGVRKNRAYWAALEGEQNCLEGEPPPAPNPG